MLTTLAQFTQFT